MSWVSDFISWVGETFIVKPVRWLGQELFGIDPDDPIGAKAQQRRAEEDAETARLNNRDLRNNFRPPSVRGNRSTYRQEIPEPFGELTYFPEYITTPRLIAARGTGSQLSSYEITTRHEFIIGFGEYDPITAEDVIMGGIPASRLNVRIRQIRNYVVYDTFKAPLEGVSLPQETPADTLAEELTAAKPTEWLTLVEMPEHLQNKTNPQTNTNPQISIKFYFNYTAGIYRIVEGVIGVNADEERPRIKVEVRAIDTSGAEIGTSTDTFIFNAGYQGNIIVEGLSTPIDIVDNIGKVEVRFTNMGKQHTVEGAVISSQNANFMEAVIGIGAFYAPPVRPLNDLTILRIDHTINSNTIFPNIKGKIKVTSKRRINYWNGTDYELRHSRNTYAIVEHLINQWQLEADFTKLRELRDAITEDTYDDIIDPQTKRNEIISSMLQPTATSVDVDNDGIITFNSDNELQTPTKLITDNEVIGQPTYLHATAQNDGVAVNYEDNNQETQTILLNRDNLITADIDGNLQITGDEVFSLDSPIKESNTSLAGRARGIRRAWQLHRRFLYRNLNIAVSLSNDSSEYQVNDAVLFYIGGGKLGTITGFTATDTGVSIETFAEIIEGTQIVMLGSNREPITITAPVITEGNLQLSGATIEGGNINYEGSTIYESATIVQATPEQLLQFKIIKNELTNDRRNLTLTIDDARVYSTVPTNEETAFYASMENLLRALIETNEYTKSDIFINSFNSNL